MQFIKFQLRISSRNTFCFPVTYVSDAVDKNAFQDYVKEHSVRLESFHWTISTFIFCLSTDRHEDEIIRNDSYIETFPWNLNQDCHATQDTSTWSWSFTNKLFQTILSINSVRTRYWGIHATILRSFRFLFCSDSYSHQSVRNSSCSVKLSNPSTIRIQLWSYLKYSSLTRNRQSWTYLRDDFCS